MLGIVIEDEKIPEYARQALEKPADFAYWGSDDMFVTWGFSGIDKHRDSKLIDISNFDVISKDLMTRFPEDFRIEGFKHWAVGHADRLVCRILLNERKGYVDENITEAFKAAMQWHNDLYYNGPYADEGHYYDMEYEEIIDSIKDLPYYLKNMIDTSDDDWCNKIYDELTRNMDVYICPDAECWPKDDEILEAAFTLNLCNPNEQESWDEWCDNNGIARYQFTKENPNQLKLFEENNE